MSPTQALDDEVSLWKDTGLRPQIWWRDDDAINVTPEFLNLSHLAKNHKMPVLLAVIPSHAARELADAIFHHEWLEAATHGYAHVNHSEAGVKKTELTENTNGRSVRDVIDELAKSREMMQQLFGLASSQILVPPWNRLSDRVLHELPSTGFKLLSTFTDKKLSPNIDQINCHIDLMHWRPERVGKTRLEVTNELLKVLRLRRLSDNPERPIGILSHHLVHDKTAWEATKFLMNSLSERPIIKMLSQPELLPNVS